MTTYLMRDRRDLPPGALYQHPESLAINRVVGFPPAVSVREGYRQDAGYIMNDGDRLFVMTDTPQDEPDMVYVLNEYGEKIPTVPKFRLGDLEVGARFKRAEDDAEWTVIREAYKNAVDPDNGVFCFDPVRSVFYRWSADMMVHVTYNPGMLDG